MDVTTFQPSPTSLYLLLAGLFLFSACTPSAPAPPTIAFTNVTESAGLSDFYHDNGDVGKRWYPEQMGSGAAFFDYNNDGWQDILLLGGGTWEDTQEPNYRSLWLYENNANGTFSLKSEEAGLGDVEAYSIGVAAADYDNDGDIDFFLSTIGPNMLFRNNDGVFTEVGQSAGIADTTQWSSSILFFDADHDGWLDLYVGTYVDWSPETDKFCPEGGVTKFYCVPADYDGLPSQFFLNNGDGTFRDATKTHGFYPAIGKSLGVVEMDYNSDGWSDLFVANDGEGDLLYENNGDGTFTEKGMVSGVAFSKHGEARAGMGVDSGVIDSSGQTTLFVGNFSEETLGVYQHVANGLFQDYTGSTRVGFPSMMTLTFGLFLFDVDLDTDLDLFVANGHVYPDRLKDQDKITFRQPPQLYLNDGGGTFDELKQEDGLLMSQLVARGAAYADFDKDGDLDVLLTENDGTAHLWRNDLTEPRFLRVSVRSAHNQDVLGTRVLAKVGDLTMERRIHTGSSYLSQSETTATFGLGHHAQVDSLLIHWPDGRITHFEDLPTNVEIQITDGDIPHMQAVPYGIE